MERLIADNLHGDLAASIPPDERFVVDRGTSLRLDIKGRRC